MGSQRAGRGRGALRPGTVLAERVGEEEDALLERLHLRVHLVGLDVRLELREVVDCTLAMRSSDDVGRVLPEVRCDLAPYCFDCCSKGVVL